MGWIGINADIQCTFADAVPRRHRIDSRQGIHATYACDIALVGRELHGGLFKDSAYLVRHQVWILLQHQGNDAPHARRGLRSAVHIGVAAKVFKVQRFDVNAWGTNVGTDEADAWVVGVVAKFGVLPGDGSLRGEIGCRVIAVDGSHGNHTTLCAWIGHLVWVEIGWGAAGRNPHVVGDRVGHQENEVAFVAGANRGDDACVQDCFTSTTQDLFVGDTSSSHTQRHADHVASMLYRPFHAASDVDGTAKSIHSSALHAHQGGIGRDSSL